MKRSTKTDIAAILISILVIVTMAVPLPQSEAPHGSETYDDKFGNYVRVSAGYSKHGSGSVKVKAKSAKQGIKIGGNVGIELGIDKFKVIKLKVKVRYWRKGKRWTRNYIWEKKRGKSSKSVTTKLPKGVKSVKVTGYAVFQGDHTNKAALPHARSKVRIRFTS